MPKSDAERAKDYRQKQMETNEMEYREKNNQKCQKRRDELRKLPGPMYCLAMISGRAERLKERYPELYEEGYFCHTLDCEKCDAEGMLEGRVVCKNCNEKHWKREWGKEG